MHKGDYITHMCNNCNNCTLFIDAIVYIFKKSIKMFADFVLVEVFNAVVLNLGLNEPQGFGESVSWVRWQKILSNKSTKN